MGYRIENGDTPRIAFVLVDATDDETSETGLTVASITTEISKNGAAWAATTNDPVEIGGSGNGRGFYYLDLTATETNTDGPLAFRAVLTGTTNEFRDVYYVESTPASVAATLTEAEREALAEVMLTYSADDAYDSTYGQAQITDGQAVNMRRLVGLLAMMGGVVAPTAGGFTIKLRSGDSTLATRTVDSTDASPDFPTQLS